MNKKPVYFDILGITNYLNGLKTIVRKLEYLKFLKNEFINLCYHYTDDNIQGYLKTLNLDTKFNRVKYSPFGDFEQSHISRSEYNSLLKEIDSNILPFLNTEIKKLDKNEIEDYKKVYKDYPIFNYNVEKILKYSNSLGKDNILYLGWMLVEFKNHMLDKFKDSPPPFPNENYKFQSDEDIINNTIFVRKITRRIALLKKNPNTKIFNKLEDVLEDIYSFDNMKKQLDTIKNFNEKLFFLEEVKKNTIQSKSKWNKELVKEIVSDTIEKIDAEINFIKKQKELLNENKEKPNNNFRKTEFEGKKEIESLNIQWKANDSDLYYLIKSLNINDVQRELFINFIKDHFLDRFGKPFSDKNIQQGINNLLNNVKSNKKSKRGYLIDDIIQESYIEDKLIFDDLIYNLASNNFILKQDINKFSKLNSSLDLP